MIIEFEANCALKYHKCNSNRSIVLVIRKREYSKFSFNIIKEINLHNPILYFNSPLFYGSEHKPSVRDISLVLVPKGHYK